MGVKRFRSAKAVGVDDFRAGWIEIRPLNSRSNDDSEDGSLRKTGKAGKSSKPSDAVTITLPGNRAAPARRSVPQSPKSGEGLRSVVLCGTDVPSGALWERIPLPPFVLPSSSYNAIL